MKWLLLALSVATLPTFAFADAANAQPYHQLSHFPPPFEASTTAPMPLDLRLAKKLVLPEPITNVQKIIDSPGAPYVPQGLGKSPGIWHRWYHDCGNSMSFGDVIVQHGQAVSLWFVDCAGETIIRDADGDFHTVDAHGNIKYFAETPKEKAHLEWVRQQEAIANRLLRKTVGVPCAMMALDIEAIAAEHVNYPNESRDELVARYVESAIVSLHAAGHDMPVSKITQIAEHFVDYVEGHSNLSPKDLKERFTADCTSGNLSW